MLNKNNTVPLANIYNILKKQPTLQQPPRLLTYTRFNITNKPFLFHSLSLWL